VRPDRGKCLSAAVAAWVLAWGSQGGDVTAWTVWAACTELGLTDRKRAAFEYGWGWLKPLVGSAVEIYEHPGAFAAGIEARAIYDRAIKSQGVATDDTR